MGARHSTPVHVHLHLLDLPQDHLLLLLAYLSLKDLPNVSRSCSQLNNLVGLHLEHQMAGKMVSCWATFLSNTGLLTQMERQLVHVSREEDLVDRRDMYRLLYLRPDMMEQVRRVSCVEERVTVIGRNNLDMIQVKLDDILGRECVRVDRVRWLQVGYSWDRVEVGRYQVSVRLRLEQNFNWPHAEDQPTVWSVTFPIEEGDEHLVVGVDRTWWRQLKKGKEPLGGLMVERDVVGRWVRVVLPEMKVMREGVVFVEVKDIVCNWWKGGISFDFWELRRLGDL